MDAEKAIIGYIRENSVSSAEEFSLGPNDSLGLDSLSLIRFVSFLENELGITIEDEELVPENFENLSSVMLLISPKLQAAEQA